MGSAFFAGVRERLSRISVEFKTVAAFGLIFLGASLFAGIADEVMEGGTREIDRMIFLALRDAADMEDPIGPGWLEYAIADLTALGGYAVLTLMVSLAAIYLLILKKAGKALVMVGAVISGSTLVSVFKASFDRARPDLVDHLTHATSSSFPSGHATSAAVTYLTLGLLLASAQPSRSAKTFIVLSAVLVAVLVGISRVYLGVHWPTDVLAGWAFGAAWSILWWLAARVLIERREPAHAIDGP